MREVPRILLLTDTFEEYAMPMFEKLGYPAVFCNSLTIDEEGSPCAIHCDVVEVRKCQKRVPDNLAENRNQP